jgi:hypothetical protein
MIWVIDRKPHGHMTADPRYDPVLRPYPRFLGYR